MLRMFMKRKNNKGFTLVELMVVVAIIGILVAIAIPIYNASQATAKKNACKANLRTINGAISMKLAETGTAPTSMGDLSTYLQETPTCPDNGTYNISSGKATCSVPGHTLP